MIVVFSPPSSTERDLLGSFNAPLDSKCYGYSAMAALYMKKPGYLRLCYFPNVKNPLGDMWWISKLLAIASFCGADYFTETLLSSHDVSYPSPSLAERASTPKDVFIDSLISNMTVPELVLQLHLMFGGNIVGPKAQNELYDFAMRPAPDAAVGSVHDWYPLNTSHYNELQKLALEKARLKIPFLHYGECLHGVGSFKQSMFPQPIAMAASWDTNLVYEVGRAIGTEARSIGIHACLSPVLDVCKDPRWGRCQGQLSSLSKGGLSC